MNTNDALLEEYKTLREEIMRTQRDRQIVIGFALTGVGTVLGLILRDTQQTANAAIIVQRLNWYAFALTSLALLMLIGALLLTREHTLTIDRIAAHIRTVIEPNVEGLSWEMHWRHYRESKKANINKVGRFLLRSSMPLGISKPLAIFYGILASGVYIMSFVIGLHHHPFAITFVTLLFLACALCCVDLYMRILKSWKVDWDAID